MKEKIRTVLRYLLAAFLLTAGINHFVDPNFYMPGLPDYLPFHSELVALSGIAEIVLALMLLFRKTMRLAGWLVAAMLIAFFAVHIDMIVHAHDKFPNRSIVVLWIRLGLQFVLIWWALWATGIGLKTRR